MGVIKTNISKVYARARDRANVHVYKKGKRAPVNVALRTVHFTSGQTKLLRNANYKLIMYSKDTLKVPEKVNETLRLCILKKLSNVYKNLTKEDYCIRFTKYPHQLLRFHAIAAGARADRISLGMSNAFGSNFMKSTKLKSNESFVEVYVSFKLETLIDKFKLEFKKLLAKVPFTGYVKILKNEL